MLACDVLVIGRSFLDDPRAGGGAPTLAARMRHLQGLLGGRLIVTDGSQGAYFVAEDHLLQVPAPAVTVRDTIGAGDNFHAALALSRNQDLAGAVCLAVASLSCREYGGRSGIASLEEARSLAATLAPRPLAP